LDGTAFAINKIYIGNIVHFQINRKLLLVKVYTGISKSLKKSHFRSANKTVEFVRPKNNFALFIKYF